MAVGIEKKSMSEAISASDILLKVRFSAVKELRLHELRIDRISEIKLILFKNTVKSAMLFHGLQSQRVATEKVPPCRSDC